VSLARVRFHAPAPVRRLAASTACVLLSASLLGGCTAGASRVAPQRSEQLLERAGFHRRSPDDPATRSQLETLTPLQVVPVTAADGSTSYMVADPKGCGCLFVGNKDAYDSYVALMDEQRAWQRDQAEDAAEMGLVDGEITDIRDFEGR